MESTFEQNFCGLWNSFIQNNNYEAPKEKQGPEKKISKTHKQKISKSPKQQISKPPKQQIDITSYLHLKQIDVAKMLGLSQATFSKKFKLATKRKWPYRLIKSIDNIIKSLPSNDPYIVELLIKKNELFEPVIITI